MDNAPNVLNQKREEAPCGHYAPLGIARICDLRFAFRGCRDHLGNRDRPDGAPFRAAFVPARHGLDSRWTVSVISDNQGHFSAENLPAGEYRVQVRAVGYKADAKTGVNLTADQNASYSFALQPAMIRWTEISSCRATSFLPNEKGKDTGFRIAWVATASSPRWRRWCATRTVGATA